jgi:4'-phosphopantetheinyl transferase
MDPQFTTSDALVVRQLPVTAGFASIPLLEPREIHVWQLDIETCGIRPSELQELLVEDELARARRFRFDSDRDRFILSRGVLRKLLGSYIGSAPESLQFSYTEYGRPLLVNAGELELEFNVSHSGGVILWAFSRARRIGVDVERVRQDFSTIEIAERFFSPAEREVLRYQSPGDRHESFFRCWTRKEAFIKAIGEGLSHPLTQFDVTLSPGDPAKLLATRPHAADAKHWQMWDVSVPIGYMAAIIAEVR